MKGNHETAKWDPAFTQQVKNAFRPLVRRWYRAEVRHVHNIPPGGGALVVSNHSGGIFTPDVSILASAFYDEFGYDRPLYTLAHYGVFMGPLDGWLRRLGVIEASRENAAAALHSGAVVLVFPGGDYDAYRPTLSANKHRLQRPHRIRQHGRRSRGAHRSHRVDRRPGDPAVLDPGQLAGP
jgi:1-acyl-sn-glycerol-3-phosphate acyltransferase